MINTYSFSKLSSSSDFSQYEFIVLRFTENCYDKYLFILETPFSDFSQFTVLRKMNEIRGIRFVIKIRGLLER